MIALRRGALALIALGLGSAVAQDAHARAGYRNRIPNGFSFDCESCHTGAEEEGWPRNAFGQAYDEAGRFWIWELAVLDSDGDGVSNGIELHDQNAIWERDDIPPGDPGTVTNPGLRSEAPEPPDGGYPPCPDIDPGTPCELDSDCGPGATCLAALSGGYCAVDATTACCPPQTKGFRTGPGVGWCLRTCNSDDDCRRHPDHFCDEDYMVCWACAATAVGTACVEDEQCGTGAWCLNDDNGPFPGGYCTVDANTYCCPEDAEEMAAGEGLNYCVAACFNNGDCRPEEGYLCIEQVCFQDQGELAEQVEEPGEGEGEGEGEVEPPFEGEGEAPREGEGEAPPEGEGEAPTEGEGEVVPREGDPGERDEDESGCGCALLGDKDADPATPRWPRLLRRR